jgi:hypothetical protein
MIWLVTQMWFLLALATGLGFVLGASLARANMDFIPERDGEGGAHPLALGAPKDAFPSLTDTSPSSSEEDHGSASPDVPPEAANTSLRTSTLMDQEARQGLRVAYLEARLRALEAHIRSRWAGEAPIMTTTIGEPSSRGGHLRDPSGSFLASPREGRADELQRLPGVGPRLEQRLHEAGVFHFDQILSLSKEETADLERRLAIPGRITFETWVSEAKRLCAERDGL